MTTVAISGGFDPLHRGHLDYIRAARTLGDRLVVIVNGDAFLTAKKGKPFQDLATRAAIVAALRDVDAVYPFEIDGDMTVCRALEDIQPDVFANGGDRVDPQTIPEWETCRRLGIILAVGVGGGKIASSSDVLARWNA